DRDDRQLIFVDEVEVALVVRRAAEDGARAVFHQYEVRDVYRQLPARIERVDRLHAGVETELLGGLDHLLGGAVPAALGDEGGKLGILGGGRGRERMVRRERHEGRAEQRVVTRGENFELVLAAGRRRRIEREADQQPFRAADPVALHQ